MVKRIFVNDGKITVVKKTRTHKVSDSMVELKKKKKFLDEVYNKKTK